MLDATRSTAAAPVVRPVSAPSAPAAAPASPVQTAAEAPLTPNPRIFFDTEIDQLVLEFRDGDGAVRASLPSEKELAAYRWAARTGGAEPGATGAAAVQPKAPTTPTTA